jgi:hypothetical protein
MTWHEHLWTRNLQKIDNLNFKTTDIVKKLCEARPVKRKLIKYHG